MSCLHSCSSCKGGCGKKQDCPLPCALPVLAQQSQGQRHRESTLCHATRRCALPSSMPLVLLKGDTTRLLLPKTRQHHRLKGRLKKQGRNWQRQQSCCDGTDAVRERRHPRMEFWLGAAACWLRRQGLPWVVVWLGSSGLMGLVAKVMEASFFPEAKIGRKIKFPH